METDGNTSESLRKIRVLINPKSGLGTSFDSFWGVLETCFGSDKTDISYQFSHTVADGQEKTRRAIQDGVDSILVAGGDGMVNSIGSELIGTSTALGVIPTGSGNGFARHFGIPMEIPRAIRSLANADRQSIDIGMANGRPFFITCSMAWDAAIVRGFEALPFRGIAPYVFAAASEWITFNPQPFEVEFDGRETVSFARPAICTVANLTQWGGGAQIAPRARPDDGMMEMVVVEHQDLPLLLVNIGRLFNGTIDQLPQVFTRPFRSLVVKRQHTAAIQIDGELVDAPPQVEIGLRSRGLSVLVPRQQAMSRNRRA
jgi:diacylglycerol kinase (ATP)